MTDSTSVQIPGSKNFYGDAHSTNNGCGLHLKSWGDVREAPVLDHHSLFIISLPPLLSFQADNQGAVPHDAAKFSHGLADVPPRHRQL